MSLEDQTRQWAREMIQKHGPLVEARCLADQKIELVFARGVASLDRTHVLKFGYQGTGPRCFHAFLEEAGLDVPLNEIETLVPPRTLKP